MINNQSNRWKQFLLNEGNMPEIDAWIQSLKESLSMIKPRSAKESKRIELMKHQLNEVRRASNRLHRENKNLREENNLLKEQEQVKE
jgi:DNA repair ATPase RecN|tara:strand:+ start:289 stop:549 length:261 start_codon:yes stop_codon:yes gene_type:complete